MVVSWSGRSRITVAVTLLAVVLAAGACAKSGNIGDIKAHPQDYNLKKVSISGEVKDVLNVPFIKAFTVKDDTGEIVVVTDRTPPAVGEHVRVTGQVDPKFALGKEIMVVISER